MFFVFCYCGDCWGEIVEFSTGSILVSNMNNIYNQNNFVVVCNCFFQIPDTSRAATLQNTIALINFCWVGIFWIRRRWLCILFSTGLLSPNWMEVAYKHGAIQQIRCDQHQPKMKYSTTSCKFCNQLEFFGDIYVFYRCIPRLWAH